MSFMEKMLNKSNSYVYYKENYQDLSIKEKSNKKELGLLRDYVEENRKDISFLKGEVLSSKAHESYYEDKYNEAERLLRLCQRRLERKDELNGFYSDLKKINIAYILSSFPNHSETFVVSEVKWLVENGYNVCVLRHKNPNKPTDIDFIVKNLLFKDESELERLLVENDIDLVHTHFVYPIGTEFTYTACERLKIPFTLFAHAYDIFKKESDESNRIDEISKSDYCKAIFTLSEFHKNYLIGRGALKDKIVITKQATNYLPSEIQPKTGKIRNIISISRFVEKKGLDVLIDSAKLLEGQDFEFSIYGFGDLEQDYRNQIKDLGCKNISLKGELPPNKVQDTLKSADLLVAPCKVAEDGDMDGFPTVIFEAMASGIPILTTKVSAIPEIIRDGQNGFITNPNSPKEFAEKIKQISDLSNEDLFEITKKAQEDVLNISSVEKTMNKYIETLQAKS